jgi:hypothetical protein
MKLLVTIDVEEEGLFEGAYPSRNVPVTNVHALAGLDPIFKEWGIRPTLLVSYQVALHLRHRELLLGLREQWSAEIGAHLHPWNTPPLDPLPFPEPVPSELMPVELLESKMKTLFEALDRMGIRPTSFRMGRFNIGPRMFSLLEKTGIQVDSSICPMRRYLGGPDHLDVPADPYFADPIDPRRPGSSTVLEVPLTIVPWLPRLGHFLERIRRRSALPDGWVSWFAAKPGSVPAQPVWVGLKMLQRAVLLHRRRGGDVITIFFHSSELVPGQFPGHPTPDHVDRFLERLRRFFAWLHREITVESFTLSELGRLYRSGGAPAGPHARRP